MSIQIGDWVQTDTKRVGKVASIDPENGHATITTVDPNELRMVAENYSMNRLAKFEIEEPSERATGDI